MTSLILIWLSDTKNHQILHKNIDILGHSAKKTFAKASVHLARVMLSWYHWTCHNEAKKNLKWDYRINQKMLSQFVSNTISTERHVALSLFCETYRKHFLNILLFFLHYSFFCTLFTKDKNPICLCAPLTSHPGHHPLHFKPFPLHSVGPSVY